MVQIPAMMIYKPVSTLYVDSEGSGSGDAGGRVFSGRVGCEDTWQQLFILA